MGSSKTPDPPKLVLPPPPPREIDPRIREARLRTRRQAALAEGRASTILTSPQGITSDRPPRKKGTLLTERDEED